MWEARHLAFITEINRFMIMRILLIISFAVLCLVGQLQAQLHPQRASVYIADKEQVINDYWLVPIAGATPFLSYAIVSETDLQALRIRFSADAKTWGAWQQVTPDGHVEQSAARQVSALYFTDSGQRFFQLAGTIKSVTVHFYSPDASPTIIAPTEGNPTPQQSCACSQPVTMKREDWCPSNNCPPNASPAFTNVSHLIVHHSAGANMANDWAAVMRAIWNFHVHINGWADIGYNWLIDPNGVLYEGRGDDVLGAHFCATNTGTMGVCLLGDFTMELPTASARQKLIELLAWKACNRALDPLGLSFHPPSGRVLRHISGHRDGCNTACPGDLFYPQLMPLAVQVYDFINTHCGGLTATADALLLQSVRLVPNPTSDVLLLRMENSLRGTLQLDVLALDGRLVFTQVFEKQYLTIQSELSLASLPAGTYWLRAQLEYRSAVWRIIKAP